jgi:hypothetical protein
MRTAGTVVRFPDRPVLFAASTGRRPQALVIAEHVLELGVGNAD